MSNLISHCSASYHYLGFHELETFALLVKAGYYGHGTTFTVLTITEAGFLLLITTYVTKRGEYENGGEAQKGDFLLARTALMNGLDFLAREVDKVALGDKDIITLSGFEPTKNSQSEGVKPGQAVVTVKRGIENELIASSPKVEHAKHYGCLVTEGAPKPDWIIISGSGKVTVDFNHPAPPVPGPEMTGFIVDLTEQRVKRFPDLKPGVMYYFYFYAVNATGVGPLSTVVSMMGA